MYIYIYIYIYIFIHICICAYACIPDGFIDYPSDNLLKSSARAQATKYLAVSFSVYVSLCFEKHSMCACTPYVCIHSMTVCVAQSFIVVSHHDTYVSVSYACLFVIVLCGQHEWKQLCGL